MTQDLRVFKQHSTLSPTVVNQTSKPVTVRSVKRRDRSKSLDKERRERKESLSENSDMEHVREERAVMV